MKNTLYENLADSLNELINLCCWFTMIWFFSFLIISGGWLIYHGEEVELTSTWAWVCFGLPVVFAFPGAIFSYYYRKAVKIYKIARFRDFWIGFGHLVEISNNESKTAMDEWIEENTHHMYMKHNTLKRAYYFMSKTDAMAFKLRWT